eukprot:52401-Eustigmatos_ZCMA.PRE.1
MDAGGHVAIVEALKASAYNVGVQAAGCSAVMAFAMAGADMDVLLELGLCEALCATLTTHRDHDGVTECACRALIWCTNTPEGQRRLVK